MDPRPQSRADSDLPQLSPEQVTEQLTHLTTRATELFGTDALFTYTEKQSGDAYTSTFAEAIDICGQHIARAAGRLTTDDLLVMLKEMHDNWQTLTATDEMFPAANGANRVDTSIERARQKREQELAKRALAEAQQAKG